MLTFCLNNSCLCLIILIGSFFLSVTIWHVQEPTKTSSMSWSITCFPLSLVTQTQDGTQKMSCVWRSTLEVFFFFSLGLSLFSTSANWFRGLKISFICITWFHDHSAGYITFKGGLEETIAQHLCHEAHWITYNSLDRPHWCLSTSMYQSTLASSSSQN